MVLFLASHLRLATFLPLANLSFRLSAAFVPLFARPDQPGKEHLSENNRRLTHFLLHLAKSEKYIRWAKVHRTYSNPVWTDCFVLVLFPLLDLPLPQEEDEAVGYRISSHPWLTLTLRILSALKAISAPSVAEPLPSCQFVLKWPSAL